MNSTEISEYDLDTWTDFVTRVMRVEQRWLQVLTVSILIVIFFVGLVGNLFTCVVIYSNKTMHTATNFYLFNMAVSDAVVSCGIFIEIYIFLTDSYHFGDVVCKAHFFFVVVLWNNSILVVTALSIERYIAIWHPLLLKSMPAWKRVTRVIICIWIIAICETALETVTVEMIRTPTFAVCYVVPYPFARIVNGILALVTFIIPLGIMIFMYSMIAFKVNRSQKCNSENNVFNHKDNRKKINKLVAAITLSFLICWLPFFSSRLLIFCFDMRRLMQFEKFWAIGYKFILLNGWMSIVMNPLLFSLMSTKFRRALKVLWLKKFKRQKQEHTVVTNV